MDVVFDRGSAEQPKGHALLYFRSNVDAAEIWVTYVVILPVSVDVSKYVPPFLIDQVAHMGPNDLSAFAFPPAPEMLGSYDDLESLATARDDDILSAGSINPADVPASMMAISEAVEWYSGIYGEIVGVIMDDEEIEPEADEVDADCERPRRHVSHESPDAQAPARWRQRDDRWPVGSSWPAQEAELQPVSPCHMLVARARSAWQLI